MGTPSTSGRSSRRRSRTRSARTPQSSTARSAAWNPDGTSNFNRLLFRRDWPHFYAFDVLSINGRDVTGLPLLERKERLRAHHAGGRVPAAVSRLDR